MTCFGILLGCQCMFKSYRKIGQNVQLLEWSAIPLDQYVGYITNIDTSERTISHKNICHIPTVSSNYWANISPRSWICFNGNAHILWPIQLFESISSEIQENWDIWYIKALLQTFCWSVGRNLRSVNFLPFCFLQTALKKQYQKWWSWALSDISPLVTEEQRGFDLRFLLWPPPYTANAMHRVGSFPMDWNVEKNWDLSGLLFKSHGSLSWETAIIGIKEVWGKILW